MLDVQQILVTTFMFIVTFFVPTVVWITLTAGLFQLISGRIHPAGRGVPASHKLAQRPVQ